MQGLRSRFNDYVRIFSSGDPAFQENIDLKKGHTLKVCEAALDIGKSLNLSDEELCVAEACGLLHDIGRFEQYSRYMTFSDHRSENHAALGVRVIKENRMLEGVDTNDAGLILRAVLYHNRFSLPEEEDEGCLFFLKLLRDADKVDIWRVVTDYYQNAGHIKNQAIELDLPDSDSISEPVYRSLMMSKLVRMSDLSTLNDFKLLQIGWIYDINFHKTFQIIKEHKYLEKIREALPENSDRVSDIYGRAVTYLNKNTATYD